jgi:hypothetical protein
MPNTVGIKLEAAIKAYLAANYQGSGMELNGVTIYLGRTPSTQSDASPLIIAAGDAGGALAQQGNFEIPVTFTIKTDFDPQSAGDTEAVLRLRHGQKVSAINGILGNERTRIVSPALTVIDAELGVNTYWKETETEDIDDTRAETLLVFVFDAYLV